MLLILLVAAVYFGNRYATPDVQAPVVVDENQGDTKKLNEIRNRADIKKQQELIVRETYLSEEKARVLAEKAEAIAKFDAEVDSIEKNLESVRAEKLSF